MRQWIEHLFAIVAPGDLLPPGALRSQTGFRFILYKHGPFSVELRDELMSMRADALIGPEQQPYPYGPTLAPTDSGQQIKATYPKTLRNRREGIRFVADRLGRKDVNQLTHRDRALRDAGGRERIATSLSAQDQRAEAARVDRERDPGGRGGRRDAHGGT